MGGTSPSHSIPLARPSKPHPHRPGLRAGKWSREPLRAKVPALCCPALLPASGPLPGKNPSPGPIPFRAQGPTHGTPNWCSSAERVNNRGLPTMARLEQEKAQDEITSICLSPGLPGVSNSKESVCNATDPGSVPALPNSWRLWATKRPVERGWAALRVTAWPSPRAWRPDFPGAAREAP